MSKLRKLLVLSVSILASSSALAKEKSIAEVIAKLLGTKVETKSAYKTRQVTQWRG